MWDLLETAERIAHQSRFVRIDPDAAIHFSRTLLKTGISLPPWQDSYHYFDGGPDTVAYILVLDTVNFCFWPALGEQKWEISYQSMFLSGYYGMAAALKRALESGIPITDPGYLAGLSMDDLRRVLRGQGNLQLMEERLRNLNELGKVLLSEFGGKAHQLVEDARGSTTRLALMLAEMLPSFCDTADYYGQKICFLKRAQIVPADLHAAFQGRKWGRFSDMDKLTVFADYKLPQVLRHLGILTYQPDLAHKVDHQIFLPAGSVEETEIRANTVWAVELIRREVNRSGKAIRAFELDWILWNMGQAAAFRQKPYHRTVTVFY